MLPATEQNTDAREPKKGSRSDRRLRVEDVRWFRTKAELFAMIARDFPRSRPYVKAYCEHHCEGRAVPVVR